MANKGKTSQLLALLALVSTLTFGLVISTSTSDAQTYTTTTTPNLLFPLCEITRPLSLGSSGEDVRCLQRYLNYSGFTVSATGMGSRGLETQYFGSLTEQAVMRWQNAYASNVLTPYGITTGTGYWGNLSFNHYVSLARTALRGF